MYRNQKRELAAKTAANCIKQKFGMSPNNFVPTIGLILGTGWRDAVNFESGYAELPLTEIPGFEKLKKLEGHKRVLYFVKIAGKWVVVLNGRVHLNESPYSKSIAKMVRLQVEMLFHLGVKTLITTCAAGTLQKEFKLESNMTLISHFNPNPSLKIGNIVIIDGFVTVYAPDMPLCAGEFCSPENAIDDRLKTIASNTNSNLRIKKTSYAMVRGPQIEGLKYDKKLLAASGAGAVGVSILPEACIADLYNAKLLGLAFITNDDGEVLSHETNIERVKAPSPLLGEYLKEIITMI